MNRMLDNRRAREGRMAGRMWTALCLALACCFGAGAAAAADVEISPLLAAHRVTVMLDLQEHLYCGLDGGGLAVWPHDDPAAYEFWYGGETISGNRITDLLWTGRYLWVASASAGLTRVADPETDPAFRQYTSNLGSMNLTALAGGIVGQSERVYYAMAGAGLGQIIDGLSGNIYTAEQDGLIANDITSMALLGDELFIGTAKGISRFKDNAFTDRNDGLPLAELTTFAAFDMVVHSDGILYLATNAGIFRWDPLTETWVESKSGGYWVSIASGEAGLFAVRQRAELDVVSELIGGDWYARELPHPIGTAVAVGAKAWVGGYRLLEGMGGGSSIAYVGRADEGAFPAWDIESSLVQNAEGATFGLDGTMWLGAFSQVCLSGFDGRQWGHLYELASESESGFGLFNYGSNVLEMATDTSGRIWFTQFTVGMIGYDPDLGTGVMLRPEDTGLSGPLILGLVAHPDGPLIITHDIVTWQGIPPYDAKVDILIDPQRWDEPQMWLALPQPGSGLPTDSRIQTAVVQERDVIWFAVWDYGLVRWDVNGPLHGPDDDLTWTDTSDDTWYGPVADFPVTTNDPKAVKGLARGPDGSIWAGGNGVTRFAYAPSIDRITVLEAYAEKTSSVVEGLISGEVNDVAVDANGDAWVLTVTGLNRVRHTEGDPVVDAWTDVANYFSNPSYALLYSPNILAPLPGLEYRDLAVSPDGERILLTSFAGAAWVEVGQGARTGTGDLAGAACYPNPWLPLGDNGLLKLGGLPADETGEELALVEIFNLEGQLVYRSRWVRPDVGFWDGRNRVGNDVASGVYAVKVTWLGLTTVIPLAVVR